MIRDGLEIVIIVADGVGVGIMLVGFMPSLWQLGPILIKASGHDEIHGI